MGVSIGGFESLIAFRMGDPGVFRGSYLFELPHESKACTLDDTVIFGFLQIRDETSTIDLQHVGPDV